MWTESRIVLIEGGHNRKTGHAPGTGDDELAGTQPGMGFEFLASLLHADIKRAGNASAAQHHFAGDGSRKGLGAEEHPTGRALVTSNKARHHGNVALDITLSNLDTVYREAFGKRQLRAMTKSPEILERSVMRSSVIPSEKYSCSGSPDMLVKGSTAIDGLSGSGNAPSVRATSG